MQLEEKHVKGKDIFLPCEPCFEVLRNILTNGVRNGIVSIDHQIKLKLFSKLSVKNGKFQCDWKEEFTIYNLDRKTLQQSLINVNKSQNVILEAGNIHIF